MKRSNACNAGKIIRVISIVLACFYVILCVKPSFAEEDVSEKMDIEISEFSIVHSDGITPYGEITAGSSYKLKLKWDARAYGDTLTQGDYFCIELPDEFQFPTNHSATHFNIVSEDGSIVANAVVDSNGSAGGGRVNVTFTDYVEGRNGINGTIYMNFTVIKTKVNAGEINTFSITVGSQQENINVHVNEPKPGTPVNPEEVLNKRSSKSSSTDEYVQWTARINFAGHTLQNAVVTDRIIVIDGDGSSQYIPDSFTLEERVYDEYGNKIETVRTWNASQLGDRIKFFDDYTRFALDLGNIGGEQYYLKYRTTYSPGLVLKNDMSLASNNNEWNDFAEFRDASSGGTGTGENSGEEPEPPKEEEPEPPKEEEPEPPKEEDPEPPKEEDPEPPKEEEPEPPKEEEPEPPKEEEPKPPKEEEPKPPKEEDLKPPKEEDPKEEKPNMNTHNKETTTSNTPRTGDSNNMAGHTLAFLIAVSILVPLIFLIKKRNR